MINLHPITDYYISTLDMPIIPLVDQTTVYSHTQSYNTLKNNLEVSCGFPVFDGYFILSMDFYKIKIEVLNKPSEKQLTQLLKIYKNSEWQDRKDNE